MGKREWKEEGMLLLLLLLVVKKDQNIVEGERWKGDIYIIQNIAAVLA